MSFQSIIQVKSTQQKAEVVVTQVVQEDCFRRSLAALEQLDSVISIACCLRTL